jgi:hypothetical protein
MERKYVYVVIILLFLTVGCTSVLPLPQPVMTGEELSKVPHRIVKSNVQARSYGFNLLGIIPVWLPSYNRAMSKVYKRAGDLEGKSIGLANASMQRTAIWFIVLSVRTITIRTDVVEILQENREGNDGTPPNLP